MTLAPDDSLPYSRERAALRAEIDRLGRFDLPVVDRENLSRRLSAAMRAIETARRRPQELSWRHASAGMSMWHRLGTLVSALIVLSACSWRIFFAHPESADAAENATTALLLALLPAFFIGMHAATPLENVVDQRRSLRGALRFARRLQSGARRPRREARGEPFVGPPAADVLTISGVVIALVAAGNGFRLAGAGLALMLMLVFVVALVRRVRIRLALPFALRYVPRVFLAVLATFLGLLYLAPHMGSVPMINLGMTVLGLAFFYAASVQLAEERVDWRGEIVERDERPVFYWIAVLVCLLPAVGAIAGVALGWSRLN